jgi:hypothetical protein
VRTKRPASLRTQADFKLQVERLETLSINTKLWKLATNYNRYDISENKVQIHYHARTREKIMFSFGGVKRQEQRTRSEYNIIHDESRPDLIVLLHRIPRCGERRKASQRRARRRREMPIGGCSESRSRHWRAQRSRRRRRAQPGPTWRELGGGETESRRCAGEAARWRATREWRRHGGGGVRGVREHR